MAYNNSCERARYLISTLCWVQLCLFISSVRVFEGFFLLFRAFRHLVFAHTVRCERFAGARETRNAIRNEKMAH